MCISILYLFSGFVTVSVVTEQSQSPTLAISPLSTLEEEDTLVFVCLVRAKIIMEGRELLCFCFFFPSATIMLLYVKKGLLHVDDKRNKLNIAFHLSHYVPNWYFLSLLMPTHPSRCCEDNLSLQRCSDMADGANYQGSHARASRSVNPPYSPIQINRHKAL